MSYDIKPHKHANEIIAWAMGKSIQFRNMYKGKPSGEWEDLERGDNCYWYDSYDYRIKPLPEPDVTIYAHIKNHSSFSCRVEITSEHNWNESGKPSYTLPANVKLTYDGETKELKAVSMI